MCIRDSSSSAPAVDRRFDEILYGVWKKTLKFIVDKRYEQEGERLTLWQAVPTVCSAWCMEQEVTHWRPRGWQGDRHPGGKGQ
eukprot:13776202-Alexandrium_andersonii.AAC.1